MDWQAALVLVPKGIPSLISMQKLPLIGEWGLI
jgi:hypothetical protein